MRESAPVSEIVLRDVTPEDLPILFEHQNDSVANRMAAFTPRDRDAFAAHWDRLLNDPSVITKVILVDGRIAGNVASFERAGVREVGYWIERESWGRGIASRALEQLLTLESRRPLYGVVVKHNLGSLRVLQKAGFEIVGEDTATFNGEPVEDFILRLDGPPEPQRAQ